MYKKLNYLELFAAALLTVSTGVVHAEDDPMQDPSVQKVLRAMNNASTWYHPDLFGEFAGTRYYAGHKYKDALKYFEIGALYADKLSQLSIGLMYLNGEGMQKDPLMAYAWLSVAAERNYPEFIATRDNVKATLTSEQLQKAEDIRKTLEARYGDEIAKHRLAVQLRQGQMQITGSHTGFDSGISQLSTNQCNGPVLVVGGRAVPQAGCAGDFFAKDRWNPKLYFASRDAQWKATVTVGAVQEKANGSSQSTEPKPVPAPPVDAASKDHQ